MYLFNRIQIVSAPYSYIAENSGKKLRSQLVDAFQVWFDAPSNKLDIIKSVIERLHTSSLLYVCFFFADSGVILSPISWLELTILKTNRSFDADVQVGSLTHISKIVSSYLVFVSVAHSIYGEAATINSANLEYFNALQLCLQLEAPEAVNIFTEEMVRLHIGQGLDIHWRVNNSCPTLGQYEEMVIDSMSWMWF